MKKIVFSLVGFCLLFDFAQAQTKKMELSVLTFPQAIQEYGGAKNLWDGIQNNRIEFKFMTQYFYSHIGLESLSFNENAVLRRKDLGYRVGTSQYPGNHYNLDFLNFGAGINLQPLNWLRFNSGLTFGFLYNKKIVEAPLLTSDGDIIVSLNQLDNKEFGLTNFRMNIFQSVNMEYPIFKDWILSFGYKFEIPLAPLINTQGQSYTSDLFSSNQEVKENWLSFFMWGIGYRF